MTRTRRQAMEILSMCASTECCSTGTAAHHLGHGVRAEHLAYAAFLDVDDGDKIIGLTICEEFAEAEAMIACGWTP